LQTSQTNKKSWLWLGGALLIFIVLSYLLSSNQPKDYPGYVSESPAPSGTKAFYTYMENNSDSIERWENAPDFLPDKKENQLLLMIEPFYVPDSMQMNEYISYMEAGNTILLFKNNPEGMFHLKANPVLAGEEAITVSNNLNEEFKAFVPSDTRLLEEDDDDVLLEDDMGVIALKRSFGDGELIVVNSPDWLANEYITDNNHIDLVFSLMESDNTYSRILVDEFIHGSGEATTAVNLYPKWLLVLTLQLILLAILLLWHQGKRFGPLRQPREAAVRFSNERTSALAAWYQRGRLYQDSLEIQADYLKLLMQEKWGISYQRRWQECGDLIIGKDIRIPKEDVQSFTKELPNLLNKQSINKQEYLAWSKKIDRLKREVEEE